MIVSDENQARVFLINIAFGIVCVAVFDLFQVLIKRYGKTTYMIILLDILHLIISFVLILYAGVKYNLGALRYYQIFGLLAGFFLARITISKFDSKVFEWLITVGCKIIRFVIKCAWMPVCFILRIVFTFIDVIEEKIIKICNKLVFKAKKIERKKQKNKKTVKKRLKMI